MKNWKTGKLENWKTGKLENWKKAGGIKPHAINRLSIID